MTSKYQCPIYHIAWHRICIDEVQQVEGQSCIAGKMAQKLSSIHRLGISGTPIVRGWKSDLKGLAHFLKSASSLPHTFERAEELQGWISSRMWRTSFSLIQQYLDLPEQVHQPVSKVRMSAIEFSVYQPRYERFLSQHLFPQLEKEMNSGTANAFTFTSLRQLLVGSSYQDLFNLLAKGSNHVLEFFPPSKKRKKKSIQRSKGSDGREEETLEEEMTLTNAITLQDIAQRLDPYFRQKEGMKLHSLLQVMSDVVKDLYYAVEERQVSPFQQGVLDECQEIYLSMFLPHQHSIPLGMRIRILTLFHYWSTSGYVQERQTSSSSRGRTKNACVSYQHHLHSMVLFPSKSLKVKELMPPELWQTVFGYLEDDFVDQLFRLYDQAFVRQYWIPCQGPLRNVKTIYDHWTDDPRPLNIDVRWSRMFHRGMHELKSPLWQYLAQVQGYSSQELMRHVSLFDRSFAELIQQSDLHNALHLDALASTFETLLGQIKDNLCDLSQDILLLGHELEIQEQETREEFSCFIQLKDPSHQIYEDSTTEVYIHKLLEEYQKCQHIQRTSKRVAGREERWQRRDEMHGQGRGHDLVNHGELSSCRLCTLWQSLENLEQKLNPPQHTGSVLLRCAVELSSSQVSHGNHESLEIIRNFIDPLKTETASCRMTLCHLREYLDHKLNWLTELQQCHEPRRSHTNPRFDKKYHTFMRPLIHEKNRAFHELRWYREYVDQINRATDTITCLSCHHTHIPIDTLELFFCGHTRCCFCPSAPAGCPLGQVTCRRKNQAMRHHRSPPYLLKKTPMKPERVLGFGSKVDQIVQDLLRLTTATDRPNKCLVFSRFQSSLDRLVLALRAQPDLAYLHYRGNPKEFPALLDEFRMQDHVSVLLLPLRACNHGLNLPIAHHVLLMEPSLHPALEEQAIARIRRLNQRFPTQVHRYVVEGTIEEVVHALFHQKTKDSGHGGEKNLNDREVHGRITTREVCLAVHHPSVST